MINIKRTKRVPKVFVINHISIFTLLKKNKRKREKEKIDPFYLVLNNK